MEESEPIVAWVRGVVAGDARALSELVEAYDPRIQALAHRLLGDRHEAEDVRQAAWLRVVEGARGIEEPRAFRTWLFRMVVNLCRDRARRSRWTRIPALAEGEEPAGPDTVVPPAEAQDEARRVAEAVRALPEDERECLVLRHWHEMPASQIALVTGRPRSTVQSALERALRRLRVRLGAEEPGRDGAAARSAGAKGAGAQRRDTDTAAGPPQDLRSEG